MATIAPLLFWLVLEGILPKWGPAGSRVFFRKSPQLVRLGEYFGS